MTTSLLLLLLLAIGPGGAKMAQVEGGQANAPKVPGLDQGLRGSGSQGFAAEICTGGYEVGRTFTKRQMPW